MFQREGFPDINPKKSHRILVRWLKEHHTDFFDFYFLQLHNPLGTIKVVRFNSNEINAIA